MTPTPVQQDERPDNVMTVQACRNLARLMKGQVMAPSERKLIDTIDFLQAELDGFRKQPAQTTQALADLLTTISSLQGKLEAAEARLAFADKTNKALQDHMGKTRTPGTVEVCEKCGTLNPTPCRGHDTEIGHLSCPIKARSGM